MNDSSISIPVPYMGHPDAVRVSWLWPAPAWAIGDIWGVTLQVEGFSPSVCLCLSNKEKR